MLVETRSSSRFPEQILSPPMGKSKREPRDPYEPPQPVAELPVSVEHAVETPVLCRQHAHPAPYGCRRGIRSSVVMSTFDLTVSTRADFDRVESRVGWAKPTGPAGACHRAGQRPDPVGPPDDRLRVPTVGRNRVGAARRTRLCPPCGYVHFIASAALILAGLAIV